MSANPKQLLNLLERSEAKSRFNRSLWSSLSRPCFTVTLSNRSLATNQAPGDCCSQGELNIILVV